MLKSKKSLGFHFLRCGATEEKAITIPLSGHNFKIYPCTATPQENIMFDAEEEADDDDGRSIPFSRRGRRGDYDSDSDYHAHLRNALSRHREDLAASEMKKFDALLLLQGGHQRPAAVDHGEEVEGGGGVMAHSIASARTLHAMGEVLRDMNDLVGAAGESSLGGVFGVCVVPAAAPHRKCASPPAPSF